MICLYFLNFVKFDFVPRCNFDTNRFGILYQEFKLFWKGKNFLMIDLPCLNFVKSDFVPRNYFSKISTNLIYEEWYKIIFDFLNKK